MQNRSLLQKQERLQRLPYKKYQTYKLNQQNTDWLQDILNELCDYDPEDQHLIIKPINLIATLDIKRDLNQRYQDYVLLHAHISADYYTVCSRCLMPAFQQIDFQFQTGFLHEQLESLTELYEQDSLILENDEYDLYFYHKNNILLQECIREQIIMHLPPYPLHDQECKGLCPQCGTNLNLTTCNCQTGQRGE